jgi:small subunit ribosomal protein S20
MEGIVPTHKSAEKRIKTAEKARVVNRQVRSSIRTSLKKVRGAATADEAAKELPNLFSMLDKAARRAQGGMTKNAASNYKSKAQKVVTAKAGNVDTKATSKPSKASGKSNKPKSTKATKAAKAAKAK